MTPDLHWHRKLLLNHSYLYLLNAYYALLGILPEPLRGLGYRLVLGRMGKGVYFDARIYIKFPWLVEIGDRVSLNRGVEIYPSGSTGHRVIIGSNVRIGPNCRLHAASHDLEVDEFPQTGDDIVIGNNCWLGASAVVLPGITIGDGAVVAAGSIVTRDVAEYTVVAGTPARVVRRRSKPQ